MARRWLLPLLLTLVVGSLSLSCSQRQPLILTEDDVDGDGWPTLIDNCRFTANDQADCDFDGIGDACDLGDSDADFIPDHLDNCPCVSNSSQLDANGNGRGDACDGTGTTTECDNKSAV